MEMTRVISFEQAKARYPHRFTMEHVPAWSRERPCNHGGTETWFYAPHFRTDREWYDATLFPGEGHVSKRDLYCFTQNLTWPLGQKLDQPFQRA